MQTHESRLPVERSRPLPSLIRSGLVRSGRAPGIVRCMTGKPSRFGVVGTGWRAQFYLRLAGLLPAQLEVVGIVGRTQDSAEQSARRWDVPAYGSLPELVNAQRPDFVVSAVPWATSVEAWATDSTL